MDWLLSPFFLTILMGGIWMAGIWTALLLANLATSPAIPLAVATIAVVLWSICRVER